MSVGELIRFGVDYPARSGVGVPPSCSGPLNLTKEPMISLKNEGTRARVTGMKPEMVLVVMVADAIYRKLGYDLIITAGTEPSKSRRKGSLHLTGYALDFRTNNIPDHNTKEAIADAIRLALGPDYDVVLESNHLHVELDPEPLPVGE